MSLITTSSESAQVRTVWAYSFWSRESGVSSSSPVIPMMPLSGVRSSWLMLATNSDFMHDVARALSRAPISSRPRASSRATRRPYNVTHTTITSIAPAITSS